MKIEKVGVVGAGMMGAEIALCFALAGMDIRMADVELSFAENGKVKQREIIERMVQKNKISAEAGEAALRRVFATGELNDLADSDLVIEAAAENLQVKTKVFGDLDHICKENTVFATNTSSLSVTSLATAVSPRRQERFIGMHFFSPASRMPLVEIVPGYLTGEEAQDVAKQMVKEIGKEYIVAKDVCGFVVNRMLNIFFIEAIRLVEEGVATPEDIDKACKLGLSHPVGPLELLDITSLDLNLSVHTTLFHEYGERFRPRPLLKKMVAAGKCGKKSKAGFYEY